MRESVFYKMAQLNCPIYEMKSKKVSLEEIFLELTASDKPVSEVSEGAKEEIHNSGDDDKIKTEAVEKDTQKKDEGGKES